MFEVRHPTFLSIRGIFLSQRQGCRFRSNGVNQRNGLSLIELLIAVGVISVILVGISAVATRSVNVQTYSKEQTQATKLAEEQIERVRAFRDRNGFNALTCASQCSIQSNLSRSTTTLTVSNFTVWFTVRQPGACPVPAGLTQMKEVVAYAQWTDRRGTHQARKTECFSDWRK